MPDWCICLDVSLEMRGKSAGAVAGDADADIGVLESKQHRLNAYTQSALCEQLRGRSPGFDVGPLLPSPPFASLGT